MNKLFVHATNIHQGGGKVLLDGLIKCNVFEGERALLLDSRLPLSSVFFNEDSIKRVYPSVVQRFLAEWWLKKQVRQDDILLCFGNLPPLFKSRGHVVVFVQNRYLLEYISLSKFPWKERLRLHIERLWFKLKISNVDLFIVQTPSMKVFLDSLIANNFPKAVRKCEHDEVAQVLPFIESVKCYKRVIEVSSRNGANNIDFAYVASGEPHKNHRRLVEAWILLAEGDLYPSLCVTLDNNIFSELTEWIDQMAVRYKLNIENLGTVPKKDVVRLYARSNALIYPSTCESFGLPLVEARQAGLAVLASELDFVRDVIDPEQSFDPLSATSIARAVRRFKGVSEQPLPLCDFDKFMSHVLGILK